MMKKDPVRLNDYSILPLDDYRQQRNLGRLVELKLYNTIQYKIYLYSRIYKTV